MQLIDFVVDNHRVPGVVASLIAHNHISFFSQKISNLSFTFVPPLSADKNNSRHWQPPKSDLLFPLPPELLPLKLGPTLW
ncbi:MAG: hypothetical protein A4E52_01961 [Pelotomaculum sp. PtaB.Bin013]|nr:MAG: hypothetical protein A4E52_01961 [Pelotomaculum sp. PtaB.Bin013]